jgi:integrase|tara:strand:- start:218 stop:1426 length:1209 start_codon:yes stop_codon:yes gene_type:complete
MTNTKSYTELETFQNGRVIIYRRSSSTSMNFHTRIRLSGVKGYVVKSCKTPDRDAAYRFALDLYEDLRVKVLAGEIINAPNASKIIDEFLETQRSKSPNRYNDINQTIGKHFRSYSQGQTLEWIDSKTITTYFDWRRQQSRYGKPTSENTLHSEAGEILRFLRWCKDMKYLREVPTFQKPIRKDVRRPHFTRTDWNKLIRKARHWINSTEHPSITRDRTLLWNYTLILANTGIRVGEARTLCWKDIRIEPNGQETEPTIVFFVSGKTGGREVVARNAKVLEYLQRIKELYAEPTPDDFVFAHRDGKPIKSFRKGFTSLIDTAGVGVDSKGDRRTIYSLRHTYATFRLEEGVSVYTLARNMGTSVAMIERFYGQTRTPDQVAELTKMRDGKRQSGTILDVLKN